MVVFFPQASEVYDDQLTKYIYQSTDLFLLELSSKSVNRLFNKLIKKHTATQLIRNITL